MKSINIFRAVSAVCLGLFWAGAAALASMKYTALVRAVPCVFVAASVLAFFVFCLCARAKP
jgi:hypothetical protein